MDKRNSLSIFGFTLINVAAVISLRGLPMMAETGMTMFFYLSFASFFFLIPCSLASAELASAWPEDGGVYRWVRAAFGPGLGFLAIWLLWLQNIIWYPTILAFSASAFAYFLLEPSYASDNYYTVTYIMIVYWSATFISCRGLKLIEKITSLAVILGTIIPGLVIIILGTLWFLNGNPIQFLVDQTSIFPSFSHYTNISFLAGIVLLFAGMENGAVHVRNLKNPKRDYPKCIFLATLIIILIFSLSCLAIAAVLPKDKINLTAGVMQAVQVLLNHFGFNWILPILGLVIAFGSVGGVLAWLTGPSKGLITTAKFGDIPPSLAYTNPNGIPTRILLLQAIIVSIVSSMYLLMKNVSVAFFLLSEMTVTLYLIVYLLIFLSVLILRYKAPNRQRGYTIPGGKIGVWGLSLVGIFSVIFAYAVAYIPPADLPISSPKLYVMTIVLGNILCIISACAIHKFKHHFANK